MPPFGIFAMFKSRLFSRLHHFEEEVSRLADIAIGVLDALRVGRDYPSNFPFDKLPPWVLSRLPFNAAPTAADDVAQTREDEPVSGNLLANDTDPERGTLRVAGTEAGPLVLETVAGGTITIEADGGYVYRPPADFSGIDRVAYTVADPRGATDGAELTITVVPVNDAPVAADLVVSTAEDRLIQVDLLGGATDADGDGLGVTEVTRLGSTGGAAGRIVLGDDGTAVYVPGRDFNGTETWAYEVSDGKGGTTTATVTFEVTAVNDEPAAVDDTASGVEDGIISGNVLANDGDVDGDDIFVPVPAGEVMLFDTEAGGIFAISRDGAFDYVPPADFNGTDRVTYTVEDTGGLRSTGLLTLEVAPQNDAPIPVNQVYTVREDVPITGNLLTGAIDPDGDALTAAILAFPDGPDIGVLNLSANGAFTYTPAPDHFGPVVWEYWVRDSASAYRPATVTFDIRPETDPYTVYEGITNVGEDGTQRIEDGITVQDPTSGQVEIYDPDGNRDFTFTLRDGLPADLFEDFALKGDGSFSFRLRQDGSGAGGPFDDLDTGESRMAGADGTAFAFTFDVTDQFGQTATGSHRIRVLGIDNETRDDTFWISSNDLTAGSRTYVSAVDGTEIAASRLGNIFDNDDLTGGLLSIDPASLDIDTPTGVAVGVFDWSTVPVPEVRDSSRFSFTIITATGSAVVDVTQDGEVRILNLGGDLLAATSEAITVSFDYRMEATGDAATLGSAGDYVSTASITLAQSLQRKEVTLGYTETLVLSGAVVETDVFRFATGITLETPQILQIDLSATVAEAEPMDLFTYARTADFDKVVLGTTGYSGGNSAGSTVDVLFNAFDDWF